MKKIRFVFFSSLLFLLSILHVNATTSTSCEYFYVDGLQGIQYDLNCSNISYNPDAFLGIKKNNFSCEFYLHDKNTNKSMKVKDYKKPSGASYDIFENLKNGDTSCPTYAVVNSSNNGFSFYSWYLTDNEDDVHKAVDSGWNKEGTSNYMIVIKHETGLTCTDFDDYFDQWDEELKEFKNNACEAFDVSSQAIFSKYQECEGFLTSRHLFSQVLSDLKVEYTSGCMDADTYNSYRQKILDYQANYEELLNNLTDKLNEGGNPNYEPETKENCSDYTVHSECYYGSQDSQGHTCYWDAGENYCRIKTTCSDFTTQASCPYESDTSRCYWNSATNTCDKKDFFTCPDYNAKENCPSYDEKGNSCVWNDKTGCEYVSPLGGISSGQIEVEPTGFTWSTISTGQICKSDNLKIPLKYIGWLLSIGKILIPIIIIALGVMDFIKAAASLKQDELPKAIKTVLVRVLAGVIIFLVPTIVNFVFVFIDDWNEYSTSYSECTTCLFNPRKC